jgi:hypothetical protein
MRRLACLVVGALLAASADAQILRIRLKPGKDAKKYDRFAVEVAGERVILGEPVPGGGIQLEPERIIYSRSEDPSQDKNELFLLDADDPSRVPYTVKDGTKTASSKKFVVAVQGTHIARIDYLMRSEDLTSLARDHAFRRQRLDERRAARDANERGSAAWFVEHQRLLVEYTTLVSWLEGLGLEPAAKRFRAELDKEGKSSAKEARAERSQRALKSVHAVETPPQLVQVSQAITGGAARFLVRESQHLRIVHVDALESGRVEQALVLGEKVIEAFRAEFVDPYLGDDFEDRIPDGPFVEFFFAPDDTRAYERFLVEYYGLGWGKFKDKILEEDGSSHVKPLEPRSLNYWKWNEDRDLPGMVTHQLGHALAGRHFGGNPMDMPQEWMEEGLGYYISFEWLGRNGVTCRQFRESEYFAPIPKEGKKTAELGLRDAYNALALGKGPRVERLILKNLHDMDDADLAKSWSYFDWLAKEGGKSGQAWMRSACKLARDKSTMIEKLRKATEELLGVSGEDAYAVLEARWREYAEKRQDTSERGKEGGR